MQFAYMSVDERRVPSRVQSTLSLFHIITFYYDYDFFSCTQQQKIVESFFSLVR